MTASPIVFTTAPPWCTVAQPIEVLLDQLEGVEVADPPVERGRAPDVGEQDGDVVDREALRSAHHLGTEQVDRDEIVHCRFVLVAALRAAEAAQDGAQPGEALHGAGAARADQQPVHLEQALSGRVQQEVDRLVGREAALGRCAVSSRASRSSRARSSTTVATGLPPA